VEATNAMKAKVARQPVTTLSRLACGQRKCSSLQRQAVLMLGVRRADKAGWQFTPCWGGLGPGNATGADVA